MAPECLPICICNPQINCKQMPAVNVDVKRLSFSADPKYYRKYRLHWSLPRKTVCFGCRDTKLLPRW